MIQHKRITWRIALLMDVQVDPTLQHNVNVEKKSGKKLGSIERRKEEAMERSKDVKEG